VDNRDCFIPHSQSARR